MKEPIYKTFKVFYYFDMPEECQDEFYKDDYQFWGNNVALELELYEMYNNPYYTENNEEPPKLKTVKWLIDNGAGEEETVIVHIKW